MSQKLNKKRNLGGCHKLKEVYIFPVVCLIFHVSSNKIQPSRWHFPPRLLKPSASVIHGSHLYSLLDRAESC